MPPFPWGLGSGGTKSPKKWEQRAWAAFSEHKNGPALLHSSYLLKNKKKKGWEFGKALPGTLVGDCSVKK